MFFSESLLLFSPIGQRKVFYSYLSSFSHAFIHVAMNLHSCGGAVGVASLTLHDAVGAGPNDTHGLDCSGSRWSFL